MMNLIFDHSSPWQIHQTFSNIHFVDIVGSFPSTILLLSKPTAYRKGINTSGRTTPKDEHISCTVQNRVKLSSGELIDGMILQLDSVI